MIVPSTLSVKSPQTLNFVLVYIVFACMKIVFEVHTLYYCYLHSHVHTLHFSKKGITIHNL